MWQHKLLARLGLGLAALWLIATASPLAGDTATFTQGVSGYAGCADTGVNNLNVNESDNADDAILVNGNAAGYQYQGLVQFQDIFGPEPGKIPASNVVIQSAVLRIWSQNGSLDPVTIHPMTISWNASATWSLLGGGLIPGVNCASVPNDTQSPATGAYVNYDVTAAVTVWSGNTAANYGWGLLDNDSDGWTWSTSRHANPDRRPMLTVSFIIEYPPADIQLTPAGAVKALGSSIFFQVMHTGTAPFTYEWRKNGSTIPGEEDDYLYFGSLGPADAGVYTVRVSNLVGNGLSNSAALTLVASTYANWQPIHFTTAEILDTAVSGEQADPDGDGLNNLLEYALGANPRRNDAGQLTAHITNPGGTPSLAVTFPIVKAVNDLTYVVEKSPDCAAWADDYTVQPADFGPEEITTFTRETPLPGGPAAKLFLKLRVQKP